MSQSREADPLESSTADRTAEEQHANGFTRRDFIRASAVTAVALGVGAQEMMPGASQPGVLSKPWLTNEFLPSPLETRVLGANSVLSKSIASLRIVTMDHRDRSPVRNAG